MFINFTFNIFLFTFQIFVAPPLFRQQPQWYQKGLTQVASRFSSIFAATPPQNLKLLPSFSGQDLMPDGKHLTPVAGLHYVLHIFDQTEALMTRVTLSDTKQIAQVQEQVRHHEDRMSYLENRHSGLQQQVCHKIAVDAEFNDWLQNRNDEDWMVIQGLPRLNVSRSEFPDAARKQVSDFIKVVLNACRSRLDFDVILVSSPFKLNNSGPTTYNVRLDSVYSSKRIRDLFSGFFREHRPVSLPPSLKGVSLRNKVTLETKIRISILRQMGDRYLNSNPGSSVKVRGYDPRPTLMTFPPRSSSERPRNYNFIQAVTTLPATFSDENLALIFQTVGDRYRGKLQSLFVVLSDDDHDRCLELARTYTRRPRPAVPQPSGSSFASGAGASSGQVTQSGRVQGRGAGMEVDGHVSFDPRLLTSIRSSPLPPPADSPRVHTVVETDLSRAHDERVRLRREQERQPTPDQDRRDLKRKDQSPSPDHHRSKKSGHKRHKSSRRHRRSRSSSGSSSGSSYSSSSGRSRHKKEKSKKSKE